MIKKMIHAFLWGLLISLPILLHVSARATADEPAPQNLDWLAPRSVTDSANAPFGATRPFILPATDGKSLIIGFNRQMSANSGDNDPWFSRSENNGIIWTDPAPIYSSAANSLQPQLALDGNHSAHAVWREGNALAYAPETGWPTALMLISEPALPPGANNPAIVASGSNTLDIIWSEGDGGNPNIHHAQSGNNGANWLNSGALATTLSSSLYPSLAIDHQGTLHVVWEEHDGTAVPGQIYYAHSTSVGWTDPLLISPISTAQDARRPKIVANNGGVFVAFTDRLEVPQNGTTVTLQWMHYVSCRADCGAIENWRSATNPVSGQAVQTNVIEPSDIVSTLVLRGGCPLIYFHGIDPNLAQTNEVIWGVGGCTGWSSSTRDQVTQSNIQALFPDLAVQSKFWTYLAYESGVNEHQIYVIRSQPDLFLPIIRGN